MPKGKHSFLWEVFPYRCHTRIAANGPKPLGSNFGMNQAYLAITRERIVQYTSVKSLQNRLNGENRFLYQGSKTIILLFEFCVFFVVVFCFQFCCIIVFVGLFGCSNSIRKQYWQIVTASQMLNATTIDFGIKLKHKKFSHIFQAFSSSKINLINHHFSYLYILAFGSLF